MKTILLTLALLTGSFVNALALMQPSTPPSLPGDSASYKLTISFGNLTQRTGTLYVGIDDSDATFNKESCRKTRIAVPVTGDVQVSFNGMPAGRYSVRVYQDLNANQKLDFSGMMPTEPFGFSNVQTLMGPPSFNRCAFNLDGPKTIQINLLGN